jgi:hypothetical protein
MREGGSCQGKAEDKAGNIEEIHCEQLDSAFWLLEGVLGV